MEIHNRDELTALSSSVTQLHLSYNTCHSLLQLDLSRFVNVKEIRIDGYSFQSVEEVKIVGLNKLEVVVIGKKCFTKHTESASYDPNHVFYLKNCERLRELKMGRYSFADYSVCEIENVNRLEVIEIGDVNAESCNFYYASLELKSDSQRME